MIYNFYQIRYSSEGAAINTPNTTIQSLTDGSVFYPYLPIFQLGIQAPPGTKVYLNNNTSAVMIGHTGLFELDLNNTNTYISDIKFDMTSITNLVESNPSNYIIVDMCYGGGSN